MNNNNHKLEEIKEALIDYYVDCGITNYKELFLDHMSADEIIREYNNLTQYAVFCGVLTEYTGNEYHVVIPRSATSIGNEVFANNKTIISVTIPDSVEIIACGAFSGCSELQSVTIPASIKQITDYDFQGCENLNTIYGEKGSYAEEYAEEKGLIFIPIEKKARIDSNRLANSTNEYSHNSTNAIPKINSAEFNIENGILYSYKGIGGNVVIPFGTTLIDENSFIQDESITSVIIPDSVTEIGCNAFMDCTELHLLTIGTGLIKIGNSAFFGCKSLKRVILPKSVSEIGDHAFLLCDQLEYVIILGDTKRITGNISNFFNTSVSTIYGVPGSWSQDYANEMKINFIPISNNTTASEVENTFFSDQSDFEFDGVFLLEYRGDKSDVIIPGFVESICDNAFENHPEITSVTIPCSVTDIDDDAFCNCTGLKTIIIPESVSLIGFEAFKGCTGLKSITLPDSVIQIGSAAFEGCTGLSSVSIGAGLTTIDMDTFNGCTSLKSVNISDRVTKIEMSAFNNCVKLESVKLGKGITQIRSYAFNGCIGLKSVVIPESLISIEEDAFESLTVLETENDSDNASVTQEKDERRFVLDIEIDNQLVSTPKIKVNIENEKQKNEEKKVNKDEPQAKAQETCTKCGKNLSHDSRFCPFCGNQRDICCLNCGNTIAENAKFCQSCGTKITK